MLTTFGGRPRWMRPTALFVAASLAMPLLAGCGGSKNDASNVPPAVDDTRGAGAGGRMAGGPAVTQPTQEKRGMSTKTKLIILGGAALAYYLYTHHQKQNGQEVQYFRSEKNGRVYYRDPQTHQAHWVTPDPNGYPVSDQDAQQLSRYQGYNNQATGDDYGKPTGTDPNGG